MEKHKPKDLDRFINGEISFEEIQGCCNEHSDSYIKNYIIFAKYERCFYSNDEHDLYEKLCYANILRLVNDHKNKEDENDWVYAQYLYAKDITYPHKMNWDILLEKIIKETNMTEYDMDRGESYYYKKKLETGSWPCDEDYDY